MASFTYDQGDFLYAAQYGAIRYISDYIKNHDVNALFILKRRTAGIDR